MDAHLVVTLLAVVAAMFSAGYLVALRGSVDLARAALTVKVEEFRSVTAAASDANNSLGKKLLSLEQRLEVIEFRTAAQVNMQGARK